MWKRRSRFRSVNHCVTVLGLAPCRRFPRACQWDVGSCWGCACAVAFFPTVLHLRIAQFGIREWAVCLRCPPSVDFGRWQGASLIRAAPVPGSSLG